MSLSLARSALKVRRTILVVNGAVSLPTTPPGRRSGSYRTLARQPVPAGSARQAVWITIGPATERWAIRLPGSYSVTSSRNSRRPMACMTIRPRRPTPGFGRIQPLGFGHRRHPHRVIGPDGQEPEHLLGGTVNDDALLDPHDRFLLHRGHRSQRSR
jgi:hypothetical protein